MSGKAATAGGEILTVRSRNQITIPKAAAEELHLQKGSLLQADVVDGEIRLRPGRFVPVAGSAAAEASARRARKQTAGKRPRFSGKSQLSKALGELKPEE